MRTLAAQCRCACLVTHIQLGAELQISMYINSPGGVVTAGLAIYDTMQVC